MEMFSKKRKAKSMKNNQNNFANFSIKEWLDRAGNFEIKNDKGQIFHFDIKITKNKLFRCSKSGSIYLNYVCQENGINILLRISDHEQKEYNYQNSLISKNLTISITLFFWELRKMNSDKSINKKMASKFNYEFSKLEKFLKSEYKQISYTWKKLSEKFKLTNKFFESKEFNFLIKESVDENFQKFSFSEIKKNILDYNTKKLNQSKDE